MGSGNNYGSALGLLPSDSQQSGHQNGTTVNTNTYDPTAKASLDSSLNSGDYSKEAAITDSRGAMTEAVNASLKAGMPAISSAGKSSGGYDSTTTSLMENDLTARSSAAGAKVMLDNIASYSKANSDNINSRTGAVNATKSGTSATTGVTDTKTGSKGGIGDLINGQGAAGTVICTELFNDGHLTARVYNADNKYVRMHFSPATVNGYRAWAVPTVLLMRKSRLFYSVVQYFGVKWSEHCAAHFISDVPKNKTGLLLIWLIAPICWALGSLLPDVTYYKLYKGS